MPQLVR